MPTQPLLLLTDTAINLRNRPPGPRPREPRLDLPDCQPCYLAGVDHVIVELVERFNPIFQPDLVLVDTAVTAPNVAELARRGFLTTAIADDEPFLIALDLEMDRWLEFPHQRERMHYRRGTPEQIPLSAPRHDVVVVAGNDCFSSQRVAETLQELRRILRPPSVIQVQRRVHCCSSVALTAPLPPHRKRSPATSTPGPNTPLNQRGETLQDLQPIVERSGFSFTDPRQPLRADGSPPRYVLWLDWQYGTSLRPSE